MPREVSELRDLEATGNIGEVSEHSLPLEEAPSRSWPRDSDGVREPIRSVVFACPPMDYLASQPVSKDGLAQDGLHPTGRAE